MISGGVVGVTRRGLRIGVIAIAALVAAVAPAWAGTANSGLRHAPRGNPLAGLRWGRMRGQSIACGRRTRPPRDATSGCWEGLPISRVRCGDGFLGWQPTADRAGVDQ
jgi:hypothetical protein